MLSKRTLSIWRQVAKVSRLNRMLLIYCALFAIIAAIIMKLETGINNYGDALWYCFVASTTIGFGDLNAVTIVGRILTVLLFIYTLIIIAVFTAVTTQFIFESIRANRNEASSVLIDDLEHLETLSTERLAEISQIIKEKIK